MRLKELARRWLGIVPQSVSAPTMNADKLPVPTASVVNDIWRVHAAMDSVYGSGFAKDNPDIVAQFMQALATQTLATELTALREIIGSGSGGFTIGLEK